MILHVSYCDTDVIVMAVFELIMCIGFLMNLVTLYKLFQVVSEISSGNQKNSCSRRNGAWDLIV